MEELLKELDEVRSYLNKEGYYNCQNKLLKIINELKNISSQLEPPVKPACEIGRPQFRDYLPADTTTQMITDIFLKNKELHSYIVALDEYIDELESKSV